MAKRSDSQMKIVEKCLISFWRKKNNQETLIFWTLELFFPMWKHQKKCAMCLNVRGKCVFLNFQCALFEGKFLVPARGELESPSQYLGGGPDPATSPRGRGQGTPTTYLKTERLPLPIPGGGGQSNTTHASCTTHNTHTHTHTHRTRINLPTPQSVAQGEHRHFFVCFVSFNLGNFFLHFSCRFFFVFVGILFRQWKKASFGPNFPPGSKILLIFFVTFAFFGPQNNYFYVKWKFFRGAEIFPKSSPSESVHPGGAPKGLGVQSCISFCKWMNFFRSFAVSINGHLHAYISKVATTLMTELSQIKRCRFQQEWYACVCMHVYNTNTRAHSHVGI